MLQIDHRESHDVDLFLSDPQYLGFVDPAKTDFEFEVMPSEYVGDGARFLKLSFENIGQIDFIAAPQLSAEPTTERLIEGVRTLVETPQEIIAKKVRYRGANIKSRDIFDIAAVGRVQRENVVAALTLDLEATRTTFERINALAPDFVNAAIGDLAIRDGFRPLGISALDDTKALFNEVVDAADA